MDASSVVISESSAKLRHAVTTSGVDISPSGAALDKKIQMPIKLILVEDHHVVRLGWERLLDANSFSVIAHATSMTEATALLENTRADVMLLDVRLSDGIAFRNLRGQRRALARIPTIIVTAFDNPTYTAQAVALGAVDAHSKAESRAEIEEAIRAAAAGTGPTGKEFIAVQAFLKSRTPIDAHELSRRESQVLRHLAFGLSNQDIGCSLGITEDTIKEHVHNVYRKLKIKDRPAAAVWAMSNLAMPSAAEAG